MSAPNLNSAVNIASGEASLNLSASFQDLVSNAAGTNQTLKVECIRVSNLTAGTAVPITAQLVRTVTQAGTYNMGTTVPLPPFNVLELITREGAHYLLEGDKIQIKADATSHADVLCSYEILG